MNLKILPIEENFDTYKCVRREFITSEFGGDPIGMYARPNTKLVQRHKIPLLICPNLSLNPYAPVMPGHPGLLFHIIERPWRDESKDKKEAEVPAPIFTRLEVNKWAYVGNYIERGERTLTMEQWRSQSDQVCLSKVKLGRSSQLGQIGQDRLDSQRAQKAMALVL